MGGASYGVGESVEENVRARARVGHVIGEATNDGCDFPVEWRDGSTQIVDRMDIRHVGRDGDV